ncbi:class I SAM-dependent methyltransferase [Photobacterium damselae]|uniref:class I SAM-dependent methyltransferase n=1 Tax=Photobacterium damselae TaxID=38293 RepID=UPI001F437465|nr:class I SAM-dependent methyltransferase [Photobacterium damselae]UKA29890.1 class I SAM-dependent methyltransferase [Photobacterium damselae subsp. damselae]
MEQKISEERFIPKVFSYENHLEHYHRYNWVLELVKDKVILDAASGEGYGSFVLSTVASKVTGVDISESAIFKAKEKYKKDNLNYICADVTKLPFEDNSFDVFISFETLEHHDKHHEMLSEVKRVLKSDGILVISSPEHYFYSLKK